MRALDNGEAEHGVNNPFRPGERAVGQAGPASSAQIAGIEVDRIVLAALRDRDAVAGCRIVAMPGRYRPGSWRIERQRAAVQ